MKSSHEKNKKKTKEIFDNTISIPFIIILVCGANERHIKHIGYQRRLSGFVETWTHRNGKGHQVFYDRISIFCVRGVVR